MFVTWATSHHFTILKLHDIYSQLTVTFSVIIGAIELIYTTAIIIMTIIVTITNTFADPRSHIL